MIIWNDQEINFLEKNMNYFAKERVNEGRQPELDWLKAVCIIGMIFLHIY